MHYWTTGVVTLSHFPKFTVIGTNICPERVDCAVQCNIANLEPINCNDVPTIPTDNEDASDYDDPFNDKDYEPSLSSDEEACESKSDRFKKLSSSFHLSSVD